VRIRVTTSVWGKHLLGVEGTVIETIGDDYAGRPYYRVRLDNGDALPPLMAHEFVEVSADHDSQPASEPPPSPPSKGEG